MVEVCTHWESGYAALKHWNGVQSKESFASARQAGADAAALPGNGTVGAIPSFGVIADEEY